MSKLRVGLIGFGSWVRSAYLPALKYDGRAVITAVTAATENTRRQALEILGENVSVFDGYEALLSNADIDAVMIAVPTVYTRRFCQLRWNRERLYSMNRLYRICVTRFR